MSEDWAEQVARAIVPGWLIKSASDKMVSAIASALREAKAAGMEEAAKIADTDEELPGPMPPEIYLVPIEDLARTVVRVTKASIASRIRAAIPVTDAWDPAQQVSKTTAEP